MQDNDARLLTPYDTNHPIENLTDQIKNDVEYAASGQNLYTPEHVVAVTYQVMFKIGLFIDDCKIWRRKDPADKTWTAFKIFFATSHQECQELQVTTAGAGFQTANVVVYQQDTVEAITNLATATASDRAAVADLTTTNSNLTTKFTACQSKLISALQEVTNLYNQNSELCRQTTNQPASKPKYNHYCWTHGYKCDHPGFRFPAPGAVHKC